MKTDIEEVKELGERIGYGHMMGLASALWRESLKPDGIENGAFIPALRSFVNGDPEVEKITDDSIEHYDIIIKNNNDE